MQHGSGLGADKQRQGVWNGVVDREELDVEGAKLFAATLFHREGVGGDLVLGEFCFDQSNGERRADDGNVISHLQQIRHRANVVFVSVGQHDRQHVIETVPDGAEVRQDQVDARLVFFRE